MPSTLVQSLFAGPLDIVGDVHGEIDALRSLMRRLGYGADGTHPDAKRLVFVGDLTDRGPDSPAVIDLVKNLVDAGCEWHSKSAAPGGGDGARKVQRARAC